MPPIWHRRPLTVVTLFRRFSRPTHNHEQPKLWSGRNPTQARWVREVAGFLPNRRSVSVRVCLSGLPNSGGKGAEGVSPACGQFFARPRTGSARGGGEVGWAGCCCAFTLASPPFFECLAGGRPLTRSGAKAAESGISTPFWRRNSTIAVRAYCERDTPPRARSISCTSSVSAQNPMSACPGLSLVTTSV